MCSFNVDIRSDITDRLATWAEQYISETSYRRYERACAFVMDETAKHVATRMREVAPAVMDNPTPWTVRDFQYRRALGKGRGVNSGVFSEFIVMDDQSIVLKYLMGAGENLHLPGDVGLARDHILLPEWENLARTPRQRGDADRGRDPRGHSGPRPAAEPDRQVADRLQGQHVKGIIVSAHLFVHATCQDLWNGKSWPTADIWNVRCPAT